jgi:hypothetical protein
VTDFEQRQSVKGGLSCTTCGEQGLANRTVPNAPLFLLLNASPIDVYDGFYKHSVSDMVDSNISVFGHPYSARMVVYSGGLHFAVMILTGEGGACYNNNISSVVAK